MTGKNKPRAKCGTYAGYSSHYYYCEPVCAECKAAAVEYHRGRFRPETSVVPRIYWDPAAA